jgi:Fe-S oxidoreductase
MIKARRRGKGHHELYTPRGLISVIRALLEERIDTSELPPQAVEAASFCTACGRCSLPCIVNKAYHEGLSPRPNIDHQQLFEAYKLTLAESGYDMGRRYRKMPGISAAAPETETESSEEPDEG